MQWQLTSFDIQVYDYLLTFDDERTLMWPKPWSPTKVLFLMIRYLPFVDQTITASRECNLYNYFLRLN